MGRQRRDRREGKQRRGETEESGDRGEGEERRWGKGKER